MRIASSLDTYQDSPWFSCSYDHMKQYCPDQKAYIDALEQIATSSLYKQHRWSLNSCSNTLHKINELMPIKNGDGIDTGKMSEDMLTARTLLGLRVIQLCQYGSKQGWFSEFTLGKLKEILCRSRFLNHADDAEVDFESIALMHRTLWNEFFEQLPYFPPRFEYIIDKYCKRHFKVLSTIPLEQLDLPETVKIRGKKEKPPIAALQIDPDDPALESYIKSIFTDHLSYLPSEEDLNNIFLDVKSSIQALLTDQKYRKSRWLEFTTPKSATENPFQCLLELSEDRQSVSLCIDIKKIFEFDEKIKEIYKAKTFLIPLNSPSKPVQFALEAHICPNKNIDPSSGSHALGQDLMDAQEVLERLKFYLPQDANIPIIRHRRFAGHYNFLKCSMPYPTTVLEPCLGSNFSEAILAKSVKNCLEPSTCKFLPITEVLGHFVKTAKFLKSIHEIGLMHGDIKTDNILLDLENDQVKSYLIDWDMSGGSQFSFLGKPDKYAFWDTAKCHGWRNPFTDDFGIGKSLGWTFLPDPFNIKDIKDRDRFIIRLIDESKKLIPKFSTRDKLIEKFQNIVSQISAPQRSLSQEEKNNDLLEIPEIIKSFLKENPSLSADHRKQLCFMALLALTMKWTLDILDKVLVMDEFVASQIKNLELAKKISKSSLQDNIDLINKIWTNAPMKLGNMLSLLEAMQTALVALEKSLEEG